MPCSSCYCFPIFLILFVDSVVLSSIYGISTSLRLHLLDSYSIDTADSHRLCFLVFPKEFPFVMILSHTKSLVLNDVLCRLCVSLMPVMFVVAADLLL